MPWYCWKFFCILHCSYYHSIHNKSIKVFWGFKTTFLHSSLRSHLIFNIPVFYMTQSLKTLSYNYWPNEKPSFAALYIQKHYSYTQTGFEYLPLHSQHLNLRRPLIELTLKHCTNPRHLIWYLESNYCSMLIFNFLF